jgi:hypothetical protein
MRTLICMLACVFLQGCVSVTINFNGPQDGGDFCKNVMLDKMQRQNVPMSDPGE